MKDNFIPFIEKVMEEYEGSKFEEVPGDAGGPTKFGITIYDIGIREGLNTVKNWTKLRTMVKNLTKDEAIAIYKTKYWNILQADDLPTGIDCSLVDHGITSGPKRAIEIAQKICKVDIDGKLGPKTLEALKTQDPKSFVIAFCEGRKEYYTNLVNKKPSNKKFLKGWHNRAEKCKSYCLELLK